MKRVLNFLSKLLISIAFTLILIEIGLHILPEVIPLNLLVFFDEEVRTEIAIRRELPTKKDTVLIERDDGGPELRIYKPFTRKTWSINEQGTTITAVMDEIGFCNLPQNSYQFSKIDIIVLGDSFTACHAVGPRDTWSSQLSTLTGVSVYNLGRIGTGLHEHIQLLKKFGLKKSPRHVIMNVYEGNDFRDARNYYDSMMKEDVQSEAISSTGLSNLQDLLLSRSYSVNLILATARYLHKSFFDASETSKVKVDLRYQLVFSSDISIPFNPENADKDEVRNAMYLTTLQTDSEVFQVIDEALRTFVELSKEYGFSPIVTYTPSAHTAYADYVVFDDPKLTGLMMSFSHEQRQYLQLKGEELGYTFIDLTPSIQAAAQSNGPDRLLYYQRDLHLTPTGHAVIANALRQAFEDLGILSK